MHAETTTARLRQHLRIYLDHVMATGERVLITRHGKELAALVPLRDFDALEKVENNREEFLVLRQNREMEEFRVLKEGMVE